ncbi:rhamnosyl/mannosyltransferase [Devosia crocina]|uniref:Rhamnosyl/mannosyltransferase n=1 Tax=Devosia crocina TaxID=429728 RepID=A0A1I7MWA5_9HYPH|nr:glycosyltransferase [Devosia crocina]SFV26680.1 rhamnosyl/mannosyltransferase [Devosia crocina]
MRVLHVYKTYPPDDFTGVPRVIHALAETMAPMGVTSTVMALSRVHGGTVQRIDGHAVHFARQDINLASAGLSLSAFGLFRRLACEADVVNYHFPWPMADLLQLLVRPKTPAVVTYHSDIVRQKSLLKLYAPIRDVFLGQVDAIVATSPNYVQTSPVLDRFPQKVSVVPIGIPEVPPADDERLARWRAEVGEGFFLFVGALRYYKGLQFLMQAARETGLPVVVAGAGDTTEWAAMGGPSVRFVGPIDDADKIALVALCRAFVFPSHLRSEAFGVALAEATRAGRAMISSEIGTGTSFVNMSGETGIVTPPEDVGALVAAMRALAESPEKAAAMGEAARRRYEELFRAEAMAEEYLRLYGRLLSR